MNTLRPEDWRDKKWHCEHIAGFHFFICASCWHCAPCTSLCPSILKCKSRYGEIADFSTLQLIEWWLVRLYLFPVAQLVASWSKNKGYRERTWVWGRNVGGIGTETETWRHEMEENKIAHRHRIFTVQLANWKYSASRDIHNCQSYLTSKFSKAQPGPGQRAKQAHARTCGTPAREHEKSTTQPPNKNSPVDGLK